jgi:hypothetical protein
MRNASGAKRGQRPEAERRIDRHADPTEPRKNRRSARSVVLPLPSEPPRSVPPPPAQGKPRTLLGLDAVI